MALKVTVSKTAPAWADVDGIKISLGERAVSADLYVKVNMVEATKEKGTAHLLLSSEGSAQMQIKQFPVDLDGPNFIKQAYEYLKTLPEFAGAADV